MTPLELTVVMKELRSRVETLEAKVAEQEQAKEVVRQMLDSAALASKPLEPARKMCPKCGVKPAYYFHVKNCPQKEQKNGANGNRSSGGT